MKLVAISMKNRLFADGAKVLLSKSGNFNTKIVSAVPSQNMILDCVALHPEIILLEIIPNVADLSFKERLEEIRRLKDLLPEVKFAMICDEIAYPELAKAVMRAKQEKKR